MRKGLLFIWFGLAVLHLPQQAYAQFTDARAYDNTPVGTNQLELNYAYARSNTSIDTSFVVTGAKFDLNQGIVDYRSEVNVSLTAQNSLIFEFAKPVVHKNGPTYTGFAVRYDYTWARGTSNRLLRSGR